ncbi:hypothetical protein BH23GEM9_BH23GEM9_32580 [soil metagenome]
MPLTRLHRQLRRVVTLLAAPGALLTAPGALLAASSALLLAACTSTRGDDAELLVAGSPDALCSLAYTQVGAIQGSGLASPMSGQSVTTQGVVVGDYEGPAPALRGFYLQDIRDDGDATTSDGIFVFNGDRDDVSIGDVVRVSGIAGEESEQTQIAASSIVACGTGSVQPTDVTLPFPSAMYLERYEGMLVRLPQMLYVTEHYQLGRFGEAVLSSGGRLPQPTAIAEPGTVALAVQAANDLNRIIIDDASHEQNPATIVFARGGSPLAADNTLRGGDHVTGIIGVLTQTSPAGPGGAAGAGATAGSSAYRVRPVNALDGDVPEFVAANPRPVAPPDVGGTLRVASFNLLNYFNTFADCTAGVGGATTACRGAENQVELERQRRKTVAAIVAMNPHILGVIEIENDGYGALSAIADLVASLNAATAAGRYAFIDADAATGQVNALGTDAIKVGLLYQPSRVSPVGRTSALNSTAFVNGGDAVLRNRPSLAQAFAQPDGRSVVVSINHFKSKGGACDTRDAGDGQAQCNAVRTVAARELIAWLAADPTRTGGTNVLILGDLNAYAREDPVSELALAGYTDLLAVRVGTSAYSYVFNGQWGYLDYALASPGLVPQVTGVAAWHINADEPTVLDYNTNFRSTTQRTSLYRADPFRSSDHDPIIVGLELTGAAAGRSR